MLRERLEVEHLRAFVARARRAAGSCPSRSARRRRDSESAAAASRAARRRGGDRRVAAVELHGAPADLVQHVRERARCAGRRASSRRAAPSRAACRAQCVSRMRRDVARDERGADASSPRTRDACACSVPTSRALVVVEHRAVDRAGHVIVGELRRAAHVDDGRGCAASASTPTRCAGATRRSLIAACQQRLRAPATRCRAVFGCACRGRMDAVGLEQREVLAEAFEEERHERRPCAPSRRRRTARRTRARTRVRSWAAASCRRSATFAPAACDAVDHRVEIVARRRELPPRSASLPPSSMTTIAGLCSVSSAGRRARPPAVVSPLIDALTTRCG